MTRLSILSALLVALATLVLAACSGEEQDQVAQTLDRAAKATKGLGMVVTSTGTVSVQGISQSLRSRATIAPDGRHARISTQTAGLSLEQYLDGHFMLMSVDSFPGAAAGGLPPGTRYLKFDIDRVNKSVGIDATLREMQSLDPRRAAAMLADVAEVKSVGSGTVGGVEVTRYSADVDVEQMVKALSKGGDDERLAKLFADDAKMKLEIALDGEDRIRGFGMKGDFVGMKMDMDAIVGSYSRDLEVKIPTKGVYDATAAIVGAMDGFKQP
ncbi:MAG TPA: hypothetical protein VGV67_13930 [Solirubrobacteraceae bacterium]|nr:hypothetical protein [Solirubrobacteraceae bacterium]